MMINTGSKKAPPSDLPQLPLPIDCLVFVDTGMLASNG